MHPRDLTAYICFYMHSSPEEIHDWLNEAYAIRGSRIDESIVLAKQSLEASKAASYPELIARSCSLLALFTMIQGDYTESRLMADHAIRYYEQLGDEKGIADAKYTMASIFYKTDNFHLGLVYLVDCSTIYRRYNDYHNLSRAEKSVGTIYEYFGDQKKAKQSYENAIKAAQEAGDINLESNAYNNYSGLLLKEGRIEEAEQMIQRSIELKGQSGDIRGMAFARYGRGKVRLAQKRYAEAEDDLNESFRIHSQVNEHLGLAMAYRQIGLMHYQQGELHQALEWVNEGLAMIERYNIALIKFKCYHLLYLIYKALNDIPSALIYLEKYLIEKEGVINSQTMRVIENYELISRMENLEREARMEIEKAELNAIRERAEEAARMKQELLSTLSHEIRTPLHAVRTIADLLMDKVKADDQILLKSMQTSADNLTLVIDNIIDFSRLDSGKISLSDSPVNMAYFVDSLRKQYVQEIAEKGLDLEVFIDPAAMGTYRFDAQRLGQAMQQLMRNAIKFTEKGRITLSVRLVREESKQHVIAFKLIDTGIGIPQKEQVLLLEQYASARHTTTRKHGGTGIGLAMVKKILELFHTQLVWESKEGQGSTFCFEVLLPRDQTPEPPVPKSNATLNNKLCLLAEDNEINAMVAEKLLAHWGIQTEWAENGHVALNMAKNKSYDFILMDIHMPEMNGFDAACAIRGEENNPNKTTPIFALTADITLADDHVQQKCFNGFLWKPLEVEKLQEALLQGITP